MLKFWTISTVQKEFNPKKKKNNNKEEEEEILQETKIKNFAIS